MKPLHIRMNRPDMILCTGTEQFSGTNAEHLSGMDTAQSSPDTENHSNDRETLSPTDTEKFSRMGTFEDELHRHGRIVFPNKGTSMLPLLRENRDLMVIERRPEGRLHKYDAVLFKRPNGTYVLHRILVVRPDGYLITGDHGWTREFVPEHAVIGILRAVVRDGKTISVTDRGYLLYVHLWCDFFPIRAALLRFFHRMNTWIHKFNRRS